MRHQDSVFHQLTKGIPWRVFDEAVAAEGSDFRVRRLRSRDQFLALLFGQLSGAASLREIEIGLKSHRARLYHLNLRPVSRSTLADANAKRPAQVFEALFMAMVGAATPGLRRKLRTPLRLIDATRIALSKPGAAWAKGAGGRKACKVHVVYDPDEALPVRAAITSWNVNDITAAKTFPIEPGATYVFDKAYYNFAWWARLHASECRFVTRFKANMVLRNVVERPVPCGDAIIADRVGHLPSRTSRSRTAPFQHPIREVTVRIETGAILRLATNDLDASAEDIAALYKRRWDIELFFKWIKQNLKIRHFLGTSKNATAIQIYVAMIAYLLIQMAKSAHSTINSLQAFARLVRLNIMHRRAINTITTPEKPVPPDKRQAEMELIKC